MSVATKKKKVVHGSRMRQAQPRLARKMRSHVIRQGGQCGSAAAPGAAAGRALSASVSSASSSTNSSPPSSSALRVHVAGLAAAGSFLLFFSGSDALAPKSHLGREADTYACAAKGTGVSIGDGAHGKTRRRVSCLLDDQSALP